MIRKLGAICQMGLTINTEHLEIGENEDVFDLTTDNIKACHTFRYLGVTFTKGIRSDRDIYTKIAPGTAKKAMRQLNIVLWNDEIYKERKPLGIYIKLLSRIFKSMAMKSGS